MKRPELLATTSFTFDPADPLEGTDYMGLDPVASVGVADIYEAVHRERRTLVSVKLLRKELLGDPNAHASLRLEAALLANLQHPGILEATAFDRTPSGRPFLVVERLVGRTLSEELLRCGPMSPNEAAELGRQILAALGAVHRRGIVHRGITSEAIFLTTNHTAKLVDFSHAKLIAPAALTFPLLGTTVTPAGAALPSGAFVAPEQRAGEPVDVRTDLFAVGALLYTLLVGRLPPPSPVRLEPAANAIPAELADVVARALATRPDDRFQSAIEFCDALARTVGSGSGVQRLGFLRTEPSVPPFPHMESLSTDEPTPTLRRRLLPPFSPEQFRPRIPSSTFRKLAALALAASTETDVGRSQPSLPGAPQLPTSIRPARFEARDVVFAIITMIFCASLTALVLLAVR